jgi:hypothetical protein
MNMIETRYRFKWSGFILICLLINDLFAQDSLYKVQLPVYIKGGFFYDFPQSVGFSGGIDFPFKRKLIASANDSNASSIKYRDWVFSADIGFYRYQFNQSGLFFSPSIGKRYSKTRPTYFEWLISAGFLRTFYDGQVYAVDGSGNVKELKYYGRFYAITGLSTVFGHNFEKNKRPKPFAIGIKPSLWFQYPYNSFILPHLSAELIFKYHFDNLNIVVKQNRMANL